MTDAASMNSGEMTPRELADRFKRGDAPRVTAGHQPRDWVYVDDVVELLRRAADSPAVHGRILHAGGGRPQTVRDLVETAVSVAGGRGKAEYGTEPPRPDEPTVWVADLTETTELTGWTPRTELRDGLERTVRYYERHLKHYV